MKVSSLPPYHYIYEPSDLVELVDLIWGEVTVKNNPPKLKHMMKLFENALKLLMIEDRETCRTVRKIQEGFIREDLRDESIQLI